MYGLYSNGATMTTMTTATPTKYDDTVHDMPTTLVPIDVVKSSEDFVSS
jgi:hypothetical protein